MFLKETKKFVREFEGKDVCLIFYDTLTEKPYINENLIMSWHLTRKKAK
jgi:hypothetical protein